MKIDRPLNTNLTELRDGLYPNPVSLIPRFITAADRGSTITLNGDMRDFKTIEIVYTFNAYNHYIQSTRMPIRNNGRGWWVSSDMLNELCSGDGSSHIVFSCKTSSSIEISTSSSSSSNWSIRGIYGWMY